MSEYAGDTVSKEPLRSGTFKFSPNEVGTLGEQIIKQILQKDGFKVKPFEEILFPEKACKKSRLLVKLCKQEAHTCFWETRPCTKDDPSHYWKSCRSNLSDYCFKVCKKWCKPRKIKKFWMMLLVKRVGEDVD